MNPFIAPAEAFAPYRWTRRDLEAHPRWRMQAPEGIERDASMLASWAKTVQNPVGLLRRGLFDLPSIRELAARMIAELDGGSGVVWVRGLPPLEEPTLRLVYLSLGLELGNVIETYGRLYDVRDTGISYRDKPIAVSQTKESTGMHTDSSGRDVCPRYVGLLCIREAPAGGASRIASAAQAHEDVRKEAPDLLPLLYRPYIRDLVTPGAERTPETVARNAFPVFEWCGRPRLRYMRYWIERGHTLAGVPLDARAPAAFDALDTALGKSENVTTFRLSPGEMLFCDNTTIAHDRDAYDDDPTAPRLLVRLWLERKHHAAP